MKTMRLGIIVLMVAALLCGCSSNNIAPTNEVSETDVSVATPDESTPTSDVSFSDGETTEETTSKPETGAEPTQPQNDTPEKTTSKQPSSNKQQDTTSKNNSQTQTPTKTPDKPTTSEKPSEKQTSSEEKPKSAFAKPFDTGAMKSELISYGKSIGMTHITNFSEDFGGGQITPEGTTWLPPVETWHYGTNSSDKLKQDICSDIKGWKNKGETTFTLWFEKDSNHSGDYIIYVIIG